MRRAPPMLLALALVLLLGGTGTLVPRGDCEEAHAECCEDTGATRNGVPDGGDTSCAPSCLACPCGRMVTPLLVEAPSLPLAPPRLVRVGWTEPLPPPAHPHARDVFQPPRG
jgi:hypothetical protein